MASPKRSFVDKHLPLLEPMPKSSLQDPEVAEAFSRYVAHIKELFLNEPDIATDLVTNSGLRNLVKTVKDIKDRSRDKRAVLTETELHLTQTYDVDLYKNIECLYTKSINDQRQRVISCEEAFFIIQKIHTQVTNHGSCTSIRNILRQQTNTYIYKEACCVSAVINMCFVCTPIFNYKCYVTIDYCQQVLIVVDEATNFVRLRPLSVGESASLVSNEERVIAIELLKVFMDFGIPEKIITPRQSLLENVIAIMASVCPNYSMPSVVDLKPARDWETFVRIKMNEYKKDKRFKDSVMACYIVQWHLNTNTFHYNTTPYSFVFGKNAPQFTWRTPPPLKTMKEKGKEEPATGNQKQNSKHVIVTRSGKTIDVIERRAKSQSRRDRVQKLDKPKKNNPEVVAFESIMNQSIIKFFNLPSQNSNNIEIDLTQDTEDDKKSKDDKKSRDNRQFKFLRYCFECNRSKRVKDMIVRSDKSAICIDCMRKTNHQKKRVQESPASESSEDSQVNFDAIVDDFETQIEAITISKV